MLPYDVIYQGNEQIARQRERLEKGVGETPRSHPRAQSACPRPADPPGRQAPDGRGLTGAMRYPLHIPRFTLTHWVTRLPPRGS